MSTESEKSVINLLGGGQAEAGWENELARPDLWNSPSGNYGPTSELTLILIALRDSDLRTLAESALRWERHLEPGVPGVAMRIEPNSSVYVPWIVLPIDGMSHVMTRYAFGQLAAERAHWWLRAWLTVAALGMATSYGKLIDDEADPPGEARPGPVYARAEVDEKPWTGATHVRRNRGILPSVLCGERSFQRSYPPKDPDADYRLTRGYMDQSQHSQIAQMALGIDWQKDPSDDGDWPVRYALAMRARFGVSGIFACLTSGELAKIRRAWETKSVEAVQAVMPFLDGWYYDRDLVLCSHDNGSLWMLCHEGGRTSTASTEAAIFDAETRESAWLAANNGMRDASETSDDIVATCGWEEGELLRSARSDNRYGVRSLRKPSGREVWRIEFSRTSNSLLIGGSSTLPPVRPEGSNQDQSIRPAEPLPPSEMAADGNPIAYHKLTGLLTGEVKRLAEICRGRMHPDAKPFAVGLAEEIRNILAS